MDIRTYLKEEPVLLFDGAMGTLYAQRTGSDAAGCELASISTPGVIRDIHLDYLAAGCHAIKTDTFSANLPLLQDEALLQRVITAACDLAVHAAEPSGAFVFADIGPLPDNTQNPGDEYIRLCRLFLAQGISCFLFETQSGPDGLEDAIAFLREAAPEAFVIVSFAVQPDGYTRTGLSGAEMLREFAALADAVGCNCVCGAHHMREFLQQTGALPVPVAAMPNAGYPTVVGSRTLYTGDIQYYAQELQAMAAGGVRILGGCCGTTPEHIRRTAALLSLTPPAAAAPAKVTTSRRTPHTNALWEKLRSGKKVIAVELDPPADANISKFMRGAWELKAAGVDAITIADCPIARARLDSSILACRLRRELQIDPLPHMTCRDRNLNATKALLLGLSMEDVHNVLVITGDPVPSAERDEVKAVYNFNSRRLARFISTLNEELETPFCIYGALNVNAHNFNMQLKLALEKEENGVRCFLTQPVLTAEGLENLKLARQTLHARILGGIIPVVSYRNACFMNSEVAGIRVSQEIMDLYKDKNREEGEELAERISVEIARQIAPYVDGYYMMTPFQRTGLMARIIEQVRPLQG